MRKLLTLLCLGATLGAASPLMASEDGRCGNTPRDKWLSEAAIKSKIGELGYEVRKIEVEKGCYEVKATDKNGAKVELYLDPASGDIVEPGTNKNKS